MKKNITMKDIAAYLDIDRTTVSKAMSGNPGVSEETLRKVKEAAELLGYRKDSFATGLITGKNNVLGIVMADIRRGIYAPLVDNFQREARKHQYGVILYYVNREKNDLLNAIDQMKQQRVSGVTFISGATTPEHDRELIELVHSGIGVNTTGRDFIHEHIDSIRFNNRRAGYDLTRHLLGLGHKRIVFHHTSSSLGTQHERKEGYVQAMAESGLRPALLQLDEAKTQVAGDTVRFSYEQLLEVWATLNNPTAIIGGNDDFALGAQHAVKRMGINTPRHMSIAGFDDLHAALGMPQITSMRMPVYESGALAVQLLLQRHGRSDKPASLDVLDYELIVRESSAVCHESEG